MRKDDLKQAQAIHGARPAKSPLRGLVVRAGIQPDALRKSADGINASSQAKGKAPKTRAQTPSQNRTCNATDLTPPTLD
jgi:hypothetical protein